MKATPEQVLELRDVARKVTSLERPLGDDGETELGDRCPARPPPEEEVELALAHETVRQVVGSLPIPSGEVIQPVSIREAAERLDMRPARCAVEARARGARAAARARSRCGSRLGGRAVGRQGGVARGVEPEALRRLVISSSRRTGPSGATTSRLVPASSSWAAALRIVPSAVESMNATSERSSTSRPPGLADAKASTVESRGVAEMSSSPVATIRWPRSMGS